MKTMAGIISKMQKICDEMAITCDGVMLIDGTVICTKEQGMAHVALYDELLDALKHQGDMAEADVTVQPVYPP